MVCGVQGGAVDIVSHCGGAVAGGVPLADHLPAGAVGKAVFQLHAPAVPAVLALAAGKTTADGATLAFGPFAVALIAGDRTVPVAEFIAGGVIAAARRISRSRTAVRTHTLAATPLGEGTIFKTSAEY